MTVLLKELMWRTSHLFWQEMRLQAEVQPDRNNQKNAPSIRTVYDLILYGCWLIVWLCIFFIKNYYWKYFIHIYDGTVETMKGLRLRNVLAKIDIMLAFKLAAANLIWIMRVELCTSWSYNYHPMITGTMLSTRRGHTWLRVRLREPAKSLSSPPPQSSTITWTNTTALKVHTHTKVINMIKIYPPT